ncbi:sensor histidine kinase [Eubacterium limosum]|jgi:two-component system, LytTR family, sensor kinase|uniref:sensor histidine kinase n=1 Tax=Eubacterium limosum TaxID=1736 RepID=UPI003719A9C3
MKSNTVLKILALVITLFSVTLLAYTIMEEHRTDELNTVLDPLTFTGTWQTSDDAAPQPLTADTKIDSDQNPSVILTGHFSQTINDGSPILFRVSNIRVQLYKNDTEIYSFGQPGTYPSFSKSPGNQWDVLLAPGGIAASDTITIRLENVYHSNNEQAFNLFLENLFMGDSGVLFRDLVTTSGSSLLLGGFILLMGLVLLAAIIILKIIKTPLSWAPFHLSLFTIASGLWIFLDFHIISLLITTNVFTNILDILSLSLIMPFLGLYLLDFVKSRARHAISGCVYAGLGFTLFFLLVQSLGIWDGYELLTPLTLLDAVAVIVILFSLIYENAHNPQRDTRFILFSCGICFIGFGDIVNYYLGFLPFNLFFKLGFTLFILAQLSYMVRYTRNTLAAARKTQALEKELVQNRIAIMLSQIQPHFLFNALTAIKQLCAIDPVKAEEAIGQFAGFLRGNLDSLSHTGAISFEKELTHIENYLSLEKMRFGKRLNIAYNIDVSDFSLPPLTVQPLVENAVRYGVTKKPSGGTVTLSTRETEDAVILTISDDGVGFDPSVKKDDGRSHIGIDNVRSRLENQCGGRLTVTTEPGSGTTATIILPKRGGNTE